MVAAWHVEIASYSLPCRPFTVRASLLSSGGVPCSCCALQLGAFCFSCINWSRREVAAALQQFKDIISFGFSIETSRGASVAEEAELAWSRGQFYNGSSSSRG